MGDMRPEPPHISFWKYSQSRNFVRGKLILHKPMQLIKTLKNQKACYYISAQLHSQFTKYNKNNIKSNNKKKTINGEGTVALQPPLDEP